MTLTEAPRILPRVNGVPLVNADDAIALDEATLRQRACTELLRQAHGDICRELERRARC